MYIQTEETPNPNALKFLPGCEISPTGPIFMNNVDEAKSNSELAVKLFDIEDVAAVFYGHDFITITKNEKADWDLLKPEVLMTMMDHIVAGLPILEEKKNATPREEIDPETLSELEKQIVEIIDTRVRPSVAMDGGDIIYKKFEDGIVYLQLHGACSGCPSSTITLKNGIESMLQHFVPEVKGVEAIE